MSAAPLIQFYEYQKAWLADQSRFKIGLKSRQIGKTFECCAEIVDDCLKREIEGRKARWVILSRGERQAKEAVDEAIKPICQAFSIVYQDILKNNASPQFYEDEFLAEESRIRYKAQEVVFPGGSRITALPANPDTARGFSANVLLDEFAFHADSRKIWAALFPVISKGGLKLRVVSTPNGRGNKFYDLWTLQNGVWSKHRTDIYEAVAQGCERNIAELREGAGDDDLWKQEYELEFLDEASAWLTYEIISACENSEAGKPEKYQGGPCYIGNDIARRSDLWVAWVWENVGGDLITREIITLKNAPFSEHERILGELMGRYNVARLAMDQTGMGEVPVERARDKWGSRVEGVLMSGGRPLSVATAAKQIFQDRRCRIPAGDTVLRADLHKIKKETGATGHPRLVASRDEHGHADRAWAAFLGLAAASGGERRYEYAAARQGEAEAYDDGRKWPEGAY